MRRGLQTTDYGGNLMAREHRVRTLLRMPPRRWRDLVVAAVVAARVERALRAGGLAHAARIGGVRVGMTGSAADVGTIHQMSFTEREREQLDTAWRLLRQPPFNGTCLRRALVGGYFVRHRDPLLRIGVTKVDGEVAAHAWLEIDGVSLDPDGADKYAVLERPEGEP
jgi:hypothetical protein